MGLKQNHERLADDSFPEGWEVLQLTTVARLESGHTPSRRNPQYWDGAIPWVSLHDTESLGEKELLDTAKKITPLGLANSSARLLPKGTVVFSRTATVGKVSVLGREMATSQDFANYICGPRVHNHFLAYLFKGMASEWKRLMAGSIHNTVYMPVFKALNVPLPPPREQEAIAEALSDADELIESLEQLLAKKRQIKQGAMQELLTGKRRLPGFGSKWKALMLDEVAILLKGSGLSRSAISQSGVRACVLYGELFTIYGRVISRVSSRTDSLGGVESKMGDVLMPGSTTTSGVDLAIASAILEDGVALGGDINIIRQRAGDFFDSVFLAYLLTYGCVSAISELAQGITIHHLYGRDLKKLSLQLPPIAEQSAIASVISDMDEELTVLEERITKARKLKQGMMQELLTGRIRLV